MVWGAPLLVEGYKKIISKSSWGGHDTSKGGTPPPSLGPHKPSSLLLQLWGKGMGGEEDKGNRGGYKGGRGSHASDIHSELVWGSPPTSLGTQVSKPPDHKEKKKANPQTLVLHTQSSCPPSRSSSAGRPQAPSSLGDPGVASPAPSPLGTEEYGLPPLVPSTAHAPTFECI